MYIVTILNLRDLLQFLVDPLAPVRLVFLGLQHFLVGRYRLLLFLVAPTY